MYLRRIGQTVGNDILNLRLRLLVRNVRENLSPRVELFVAEGPSATDG
jgi:hypothetical protein